MSEEHLSSGDEEMHDVDEISSSNIDENTDIQRDEQLSNHGSHNDDGDDQDVQEEDESMPEENLIGLVNDDDDQDHGSYHDGDEGDEAMPDQDEENVADAGEDQYQDLLEKLTRDWLLAESDHHVSKVATNLFWKIGLKYFHRLMVAKENENVRRKVPQFVQIRRKQKTSHIPRVSMDIAYQDKATGEVHIVEDTEVTPVNRFPPSTHTKVYEVATVQVC